jgi:hypothetical protein
MYVDCDVHNVNFCTCPKGFVVDVQKLIEKLEDYVCSLCGSPPSPKHIKLSRLKAEIFDQTQELKLLKGSLGQWFAKPFANREKIRKQKKVIQDLKKELETLEAEDVSLPPSS